MRAVALTVALTLAWLTSGCVIRYEVRDTEFSVESGDGTGSAGQGEGSAGQSEGGAGQSEGSGSGPPASCDPDEIVCGLDCARTQSSPDHCGGCGLPCAPGFACDRGECRDGCRDSNEICDRYCVDLDTDPLHCGGCQQACQATDVCTDGTCEPVR